jgi:hypothetical protein
VADDDDEDEYGFVEEGSDGVIGMDEDDGVFGMEVDGKEGREEVVLLLTS